MKKLKKSAVNRSFSRSVRLKFLNSETSVFQARGPRKKARAFEFTVSVIDVSRDRSVRQCLRQPVVECGAQGTQQARAAIDRHQRLQLLQVDIGGARRIEIAAEVEALRPAVQVQRQALIGAERRIAEQILAGGDAQPCAAAPVADRWRSASRRSRASSAREAPLPNAFPLPNGRS